jgi:8-oxo-dGTP pyrophosphatase MutT (NUDIX family)
MSVRCKVVGKSLRRFDVRTRAVSARYPAVTNDAPLPAAIPAATLVIFRAAAGAPELLMVERAKAMAFAGGAMVFPGGRVDPGDWAMAALHDGGDLDEMAARIAAIRETVEEAGLPVALVPIPDPATLRAIRAGLHRGEPFGGLLAAAGLALRIEALAPFARWRPAHPTTRIFDTRFYLVEAPDGEALATVDATENVRLVWTTAAAMLAEAEAGSATIIFPTRRNLERLARFASFAAAAADAAAHPVRMVTPWEEERDGARLLCIPGDLGYPVTSEPIGTALRG